MRRTHLGKSIALASALALSLGLANVGCQQKKAPAPAEDPYFGEGGLSDELPISRVALYQNGVGYFERVGVVEGEELTLRIRPDQINDILKSLTVIDLGEGRPVSISLPVDKNAIDALSSLPSQIRDEGGLLSLLEAFRGARVSINNNEIEGRIVGLESLRVLDNNGNSAEQWKATIKQGDGVLRVVALEDIHQLKINDRTLEVGLEKSLDISLNEGSWKPIELKVRMSNADKKKVLLSYIVAMPVWKPAYRLVLGEEDEGLFQGWAVVDNVSGSDWTDVAMALVAGTPMSFQYDLYSPQFVSRPDLTSRGRHAAIAPPVSESAWAADTTTTIGGLTDRNAAPAAARGMTGKGGGGWGGEGSLGDDDYYGYDQGAAPADEPMEAEESAKLRMEDYEANFQTASTGAEVSALFQYDIANPVTVPDRASALVNLVQSKGEAKEIVLFQPELYYAYDALQPYRAVEFMNTSSYDLEPGPITLYKANAFIGEGFLPRTAEGAVAYVTFAMDPEITLKNSSLETEEAAKIIRIYGGNVESELKSVTTVTYSLTNHRKEAVTAVIRRPIRAGWSLEPEPADMKQAASAYYIPVELAGGETKEMKLREVTPVRRTLSLDSTVTLELLKIQASEDALDPELKKQIDEVIAKKAELNTLEEELADLRAQKYEFSQEASRIANSLADIKDINESSAKALRDQLVKRASSIESDIAQRATRIAELSLQQSDTERTLRALFRSITFESQKPADPPK